MRAGVVTGEAAVTIGAEGEGMVAGDLVNTASRVQSRRRAGHGARRRADPAGERGGDRLRGRGRARAEGQGGAGAALACAARDRRPRRGEGRTTGSRRRSSAATASCGWSRSSSTPRPTSAGRSLVSVVGIAGIGKSRLAWEFEHYIDGLADDVFWHRGRCLAYGDGVAYWALAEMVRMRPGSPRRRTPDEAARKLARDARGAPARRGRARLGRAAARTAARSRASRPPSTATSCSRPGGCSSSGSPSSSPVVLVFEDLQWADPACSTSSSYLLDWSRSHPIFVLALRGPS